MKFIALSALTLIFVFAAVTKVQADEITRYNLISTQKDPGGHQTRADGIINNRYSMEIFCYQNSDSVSMLDNQPNDELNVPHNELIAIAMFSKHEDCAAALKCARAGLASPADPLIIRINTNTNSVASIGLPAKCKK